MVLKGLLNPINLLKAETLDIDEHSKVVVIDKNANLVFVVFKIIIPSFKDFNNS